VAVNDHIILPVFVSTASVAPGQAAADRSAESLRISFTFTFGFFRKDIRSLLLWLIDRAYILAHIKLISSNFGDFLLVGGWVETVKVSTQPPYAVYYPHYGYFISRWAIL